MEALRVYIHLLTQDASKSIIFSLEGMACQVSFDQHILNIT
jgi:hypothetical protein